jgi:hypothetical protein
MRFSFVNRHAACLFRVDEAQLEAFPAIPEKIPASGSRCVPLEMLAHK